LAPPGMLVDFSYWSAAIALNNSLKLKTCLHQQSPVIETSSETKAWPDASVCSRKYHQN
jgi:hypothetical protein